MQEGLKIVVGTDVTQAIQGMKQLEAQSNKTGAALNKGLAKNIAGTNTTLVNFGRVVQDAPFGLIGIANNIDPLIQSFQSLKQQTGSTGSALRALVGGLTGPAGIAIAVSAVTSAFIAFGPQIKAALTNVSALDEAITKIAVSGGEALKKAQLEYKGLLDTINNSNVSFDRQQNALNKINNELSKYGVQIKDVASFQRNAAQIGVLYAQIKQEEARGIALASAAAEEYGKQIAATATIQRAQSVLNQQATSGVTTGAFAKALKDLIAAFQEYNAIRQKSSSQNIEKQFNIELENSNKNLQGLIQQLLKIPGVYEQFGKGAKGASEKTKELNDLLLAQKGIIAGVAFQIAAENKELRDNILLQQELIRLGNQRANQLQQQGRGVTTADLSLLREAGGGRSPVEQLGDLAGEFQKVNNNALQLQDTINNGINAGIDQFFNAIANNQDPFKALVQSAQRLVAELAAAVVKALILKAITTAAGAPGADRLVPSFGRGLSGGGVVRGDLLQLAVLGRG